MTVRWGGGLGARGGAGGHALGGDQLTPAGSSLAPAEASSSISISGPQFSTCLTGPLCMQRKGFCKDEKQSRILTSGLIQIPVSKGQRSQCGQVALVGCRDLG